MRIVFAGIIGRYPWGGVAWCSLMYLLGLRSLGHEVWYLEDTCECNYDPHADAMATDPRYALKHINETLEPFGFGSRWCYVDYQGGHHGISENSWKAICESADVLIVLSGGVWNWRPHYSRIPMKAFIDSDPGFTQLAISNAASRDDQKSSWYEDFFRVYDRLFTFGGCIGQNGNTIPTGEFHWIHTTQPISTNLWNPQGSAMPSRRSWTTIMTWKIESFADIGGNKDREFMHVVNLPARMGSGGPSFELAVNGPRRFLEKHGWICVNAFDVSSDLWRYRNYITSSRGEFSVAKHTYVANNTGWLSDRTACYLSAGKPAVVQETGLSQWIPTGSGLLTWATADEAIEQLHRVEADYEYHCVAARKIALDYLDAHQVLTKMLKHLC